MIHEIIFLILLLALFQKADIYFTYFFGVVSETKLAKLDVLMMILVITVWFLENVRCVKPKPFVCDRD